MTDAKEVLSRAFDQEPPLRLDKDAVISAGRRTLKRRRAVAVSGVAAVVIGAVLGVTSLTGRGAAGQVGPAVQPTTVSTSPSAAPTSPTPTGTSTTRRPAAPGGVELDPADVAALNKAFNAGVLLWPPGVEVPDPEFVFGRDGTAVTWVDTVSGKRAVTVAVYRVTDQRRPAMDCVSAQNGRKLPDCSTRTLEDGTRVRLDVSAPPGAVAVVSVNALRPDGTAVELLETAGDGPEHRKSRVLGDEALIGLATQPGLVLK
ncbi:MAG TPA: hypothetical protein VM677_18470 [Actinokineospora sp.]|nr:hypothetical protein [Actinokineospora sp.]